MGRAVAVLGVLVAMLAAAPSAWAQEATIPAGVTVSGVDVGGMTEEEATQALNAFFNEPLTLAFGTGTLRVHADRLGARARVPHAVQAAFAAAPGAALTLQVAILDWKLKLWLKRRATIFDRDAVSAKARLAGLVPRLSAARPGRQLIRKHARIRLRLALQRHKRETVNMPVRTLKPAYSANRFGPAIVIRRGSKRLYVYRAAGPGAMRFFRSFPVATGMAAYPTPLGHFTIRRLARNPWWYPPSSDWAKGAEPIPPGPGNPLGTRWMGLSAGGVGIHGTPDAASIGYSASHGCIRMHIGDAEWLFERVRIGTPVFIVAS